MLHTCSPRSWAAERPVGEEHGETDYIARDVTHALSDDGVGDKEHLCEQFGVKDK